MAKLLITTLALGLLTTGSFAKEISEKFNKNAKELTANLEAKKPTLIVFSAQWCGPCNTLKTEVWNTSDFSNLTDSHDFTPFYLDIDTAENEKLMEKYNIEDIPTVIYVKANSEKAEGDLTHGVESLENIKKNIDSHFSN